MRRPEENKIALQKRDLEILKLVYDFRFIQSDQITALLSGSERNILRRLQLLFYNGYLDRFVDHRRIQIRTGSDRMTYAITRKAGGLLATEAGLDWAKLDWDTKNRRMSEPYIKHTLMISKFRATLTLACRSKDSLEVESWLENRGTGRNVNREISDRVWVEGKDGKEKHLPIVPDAFFRLRIEDEEDYLFLEAERGNHERQPIFKKALSLPSLEGAGRIREKIQPHPFSGAHRDAVQRETRQLEASGQGVRKGRDVLVYFRELLLPGKTGVDL